VLGLFHYVCAYIQASASSPSAECSHKLFLDSCKRVAEMEKVHNSVAEELQRRYACPGCGTNNMAGVEEAAQTSSN
jgi:hypothetical protein